jgi:large subunit ribosomal protein L4
MTLQVPVINGQGSASTIEVAEQVFGQLFNETLIHQLVTKYLAGARAGTKAQKNSFRCKWWRYKAISSKRNRPR